jgi:hypothetical protein
MTMNVDLRDGLYQVTARYLCGGFVVEGGRVTHCAPILRQRLSHWVRLARRVPDRDVPRWRARIEGWNDE